MDSRRAEIGHELDLTQRIARSGRNRQHPQSLRAILEA